MTPEEIKALEDKLAAAEETIAGLKDENSTLKQVVAELKANAPAEEVVEEKPTLPEKAFKVEGKSYKFVVARFNVPGIGIMTAKEAIADKDVLKKLVEAGSAVIEEVA